MEAPLLELNGEAIVHFSRPSAHFNMQQTGDGCSDHGQGRKFSFSPQARNPPKQKGLPKPSACAHTHARTHVQTHARTQSTAATVSSQARLIVQLLLLLLLKRKALINKTHY